MDELVVSRSPHAPSDVLFEEGATSAAKVNRAADLASGSQRQWAAMPAISRERALATVAAVLEERSGELAALVVREVGKPLAEARGEVARAAAVVRFYSQQTLAANGEVFPSGSPDAMQFVVRRPVGIAGLITPWNFPVLIPLWKAAAALAYGNAVLLKPAPAASACARWLEDLVAGSLPAHLLQVLPGGAETGRAVVERSDALSFTGSTAVGSALAAHANRLGRPVQAEMGGLNASIVLPDADVEFAAGVIASAAMAYAGQKCTATRRVIVVGDPDALTEALAEQVRALPCGDPASAGTVVGPVIDDLSRQRVLDAARTEQSQGARVLAGPKPFGPGWGVTPALLDRIDASSPLLREELFGPVCVIIRAGSADEAVARTNETQYGLSAAVFTHDLDMALRLVPRLDAGMVRVNGPTTGADHHIPFGGVKRSSIGPRELGTSAAAFYTHQQTVSFGPQPWAAVDPLEEPVA